jgi:hypothetical protein
LPLNVEKVIALDESPVIKRIRPREKHFFLCKLKADSEILDVGCGNNSRFLTKRVLPSCVYTRIDIGDYNQTEPKMTDRYIITTPENFAEEIGKFKECFDAEWESQKEISDK